MAMDHSWITISQIACASDLAHPTEQRYTRSEKTVILDHGGSFLWTSDIHRMGRHRLPWTTQGVA